MLHNQLCYNGSVPDSAAKLLEPPAGELVEAFAAIVGREHVAFGAAVRAAYSRDVWPRSTLQMEGGEFEFPPLLVVWPGSVEEVRAAVLEAMKQNLPVVPYGCGSGVAGGAVPSKGGVVLDLKRLDQLLYLDEVSHLVTAEVGIVGELFERELNRRGFTLGHFPSSIYCSSLGGWLAARSAGQLSAKYGKIEDMVRSLQVVLPDGRLFETLTVPRVAGGPDWNQVFVGSEGTLGVITRATLRVWPYPASRRFQAFLFPSLSSGLQAIREMLQAELRPAAIRLYDPVDTFFSGKAKTMEHAHPAAGPAPSSLEGISHDQRRHPEKKDRLGYLPRRLMPYLFQPRLLNYLLDRAKVCKMVLTFEGEPEITACELEQARGIGTRLGAKDLGEGPARHWWEKRYKVSYAMSTAFDLGLFVDTIEVATLWENLEDLYSAIRKAIRPQAFVMAHFSHAYPQGCSIYFTFSAGGRTMANRIKRYDRIWEAALNACVELGGTITHHHGVGLLKAKWLEQEEGGAHPILQGLKQTLDPKGLMNPGKLGLSRLMPQA